MVARVHCVILFPLIYAYKFGFRSLTFHFALAKTIYLLQFCSVYWEEQLGLDSCGPLVLKWVKSPGHSKPWAFLFDPMFGWLGWGIIVPHLASCWQSCGRRFHPLLKPYPFPCVYIFQLIYSEGVICVIRLISGILCLYPSTSPKLLLHAPCGRGQVIRWGSSFKQFW